MRLKHFSLKYVERQANSTRAVRKLSIITNWLKRRPWLSGAVVFILIALFAGYIWYKTDVFFIKHLEVNSESQLFVTHQTVRDLLEPYLATSILSTDPSRIETELYDAFDALDYISVTRSLPDSLIITYREKKPALVFGVGDKRHVFDPQGEPITVLEPGDGVQLEVPFIEITASEDGIFNSEDLLDNAPEILSIVNYDWDHLGVRVSNISFSDSGLKMDVFGGDSSKFEVVHLLLSQRKDVATQLLTLQTLLESSEIRWGEISEVDLRFERPVIR